MSESEMVECPYADGFHEAHPRKTPMCKLLRATLKRTRCPVGHHNKRICHYYQTARAEAAEKERDAAWADSRRWRGIARALRHFVPGGHAQYSIGTGADRDAAIGRYNAAVKGEK